MQRNDLSSPQTDMTLEDNGVRMINVLGEAMFLNTLSTPAFYEFASLLLQMKRIPEDKL